jgi:hypothetical protein
MDKTRKTRSRLQAVGLWPEGYEDHQMDDEEGLRNVIRADMDNLQGADLVAVAAMVRGLAMEMETDDLEGDEGLAPFRRAVEDWAD